MYIPLWQILGFQPAPVQYPQQSSNEILEPVANVVSDIVVIFLIVSRMLQNLSSVSKITETVRNLRCTWSWSHIGHH